MGLHLHSCRPRPRSRSTTVVGLAMLTALSGALSSSPTLASPPTTVVLVRHAEKKTGTNPELTSAGHQRAEALAKALQDTAITAVYATATCRTVQTAQPMARALGLPVQFPQSTRDPGIASCAATIDVPTLALPSMSPLALRDHIESEHRGEAVLVVGHSNTVPELIEAFGAGPLCPDVFPLHAGRCLLPEAEFDHLIVIVVSDQGVAQSIRTRYGSH